jgi:MraZ protein
MGAEDSLPSKEYLRFTFFRDISEQAVEVRNQPLHRVRGERQRMFRGNHPAKVDEKGRLKLPSAFKQLVDANNVTQFYVTSTDGKSAEIWPLPEWEKREEQLADSSTMDDAVRKYLNVTSYYGQQVEMDNQARLLLPQILRNAAQLDGEVTVFGIRTYLEVHNRENFEQNLAANQLTADDRKTMAEILRKKP